MGDGRLKVNIVQRKKRLELSERDDNEGKVFWINDGMAMNNSRGYNHIQIYHS